MPKALQTQWDFGKPAAAAEAPERRVFSVAELTSKIRSTLETNVGFPWVSGEITNFRLQTSGHSYFTLKDQYAQISCVLFKADVRSLDRELLKDGQTIILQGEMTVYEPRGQYQLRVMNVELQGAGKLQAAFERLKAKLNAEGLFAATRKRAIPKFVARIGIVTSVDGAALHDVLHVLERRQPGLEVFLAPCRVQGAGASQEIAQSLKLLNDFSETNSTHKLDLVLLTRGGGSLEDLWAFNEELTARAIVASALPVISAVGHEIDVTISDFAADLRAATPSAAAELITEAAVGSREAVSQFGSRLAKLVAQQLQWRRDELAQLRSALERRQPNRVLRERQQRLDDLRDSLERSARAHLRNARENFRNAAERFRRLRPTERIERLRRELAQHERHLRLLNPQNTLERGYSITMDAETGAILRNAEKVKRGQSLRTRLAHGEVESNAAQSYPEARK